MITQYQVMCIMTSTTVGVGVLALPRMVANLAETGAPLAILLGMLLSLLIAWPWIRIGKHHPNATIIQTTQKLCGLVSIPINLSYVMLAGLLTAMAAREFGEVVITSILTSTPLEVTIVIMLLLAALGVRNNIGTFARIHEFYLPFILIPGLIIFFLSLKDARLIHLLPVSGTSLLQVGNAALMTAGFFQGFVVLGMIIPFLKTPGKMGWAVATGIFVAGMSFLLSVVASLGFFGSGETSGLMWPTLELAKATTIPGNIMERLDAAFIAVWVTAVYTTLVSTYFIVTVGLSQMFYLEDHRAFTFPMLPILFAVALSPPNVDVLYHIIRLTAFYGLVVTISHPLILLVVDQLQAGLRSSRRMRG